MEFLSLSLSLSFGGASFFQFKVLSLPKQDILQVLPGTSPGSKPRILKQRTVVTMTDSDVETLGGASELKSYLSLTRPDTQSGEHA